MRNYRGERIDNGGLVYGDLIRCGKRRYILKGVDAPGWLKETKLLYIAGENLIEVHPESVGQSTGLTDKNGVEKYPGDIKKTLCLTPEFEEPLTGEPEINNGRFQCDTKITAKLTVIDYIEEITGVQINKQVGYIASVEEVYSAFDLPSTIGKEEFEECILCHVREAGFDVNSAQDILDCIEIGEVIGNTTDNPELLEKPK